ncbi:MAG: response regulator [Alphaproteobacteria bacterium]|nr:MAG: response regulator [Alphaproteobacteria bacterium]PZO35184.1 MAG: response regulator [Alphaproteobacteria bacterium]
MTHVRNCHAVLVVDDEALLRLDATEALRYAGCTTYEACDAHGALEMLDLHPEICVLFTDINMPGDLDGLALAMQVHRLHPHIRMIITSGHEKPSASDLPQDGSFVAKPYNMDDITEIICGASMSNQQTA